MNQKQQIQFAIQTNKNGIIEQIGKSYILQPKIKYDGRKTKWVEPKTKNNTYQGELKL